jgi:hypothetical protein
MNSDSCYRIKIHYRSPLPSERHKRRHDERCRSEIKSKKRSVGSARSHYFISSHREHTPHPDKDDP